MNLKKAKHLRRLVSSFAQVPWHQAEYVESNHPKEKAHQKMYLMKAVKFTRAGLKDISYQVPIKVGTVKLQKDCGKAVYRKYKQVI